MIMSDKRTHLYYGRTVRRLMPIHRHMGRNNLNALSSTKQREAMDGRRRRASLAAEPGGDTSLGAINGLRMQDQMAMHRTPHTQ